MSCLCGKKVERLHSNKVTCKSCGQLSHATCYNVRSADIATFKCMFCDKSGRRNSLIHSPPSMAKKLMSANGSIAIVASTTTTATNVTAVATSVAASNGAAANIASSDIGQTSSVISPNANANVNNGGIHNNNLIETALNQQTGCFAELIDSKLKEQRAFFEECVKIVEDKVMRQLSGIAANISALGAKVLDVEKRCNIFDNELEQIKLKLSVLENSNVASDFVIRNVPNEFDTSAVVSTLLNSISCPVQPVNVFRVNNKPDSTNCVPIIVKLQSSFDRIKMFQCIAEFRKKHKRQLTLSDCGVGGGNHILVHECLTSYNRNLLHSALNLKKDNLFHSVYTLRGWVYVRRIKEGKSIKVPDMETLNKIAGDINLMA